MLRRDSVAIEKTNKARSGEPPPTRIACYAPGARELFVAGTFNNWNPRATPMRKGLNGQWEVQLNLPRARHEYKFIADGDWCCEPGHSDEACGCTPEGCVPNELGTLNRVVEV
ncbi:MAG: glycogen-binding domain-containing protein [Phycisphaerales bacterium]|nr:glycogen-binding domain-containing protein [Phycisphaerales bacterium]